MAESENMLLRVYVRFQEGKPLSYVRAAPIVNARPEAGRLIVRMRNDAEVGLDAMPGVFAKRAPQTGDMYVVSPDGTAEIMALSDFLQCCREIQEHEVPGAPAPLPAGHSVSPAIHPTVFLDEPQPFTAAAPTTLPPLSSWENPEDAPAPVLPPVTRIVPAREANDPPPPPATPIDNLVEREGKLNANIEQPALSGGFVSTGGEPTARDAALVDAHKQEAEQHPIQEPAGDDASFGAYNPPALGGSLDRAAEEFPHSVPTQIPQSEVEPAAPSQSPPVDGAAPAISHVPANDHSTIQYRDPVQGEPAPVGTATTTAGAAEPTGLDGLADQGDAPAEKAPGEG